MLADARRAEQQRLERTFNWARFVGAALAFLLGPLFPNVGLPYVLLLGVLLLAHAAAATILLRLDWSRRRYETVSRYVFAVDTLVIVWAMFVFSADPLWTTFVIGTLLIIGGGFRFGGTGALLTALTMSVAYVTISLYRQETFGYAAALPRLGFHVAVYLLAAFLMSGILRELAVLRAQREDFLRQSAETSALRELDRLKSEFLAAMSHDFRSPLTVVRGAVELLLGEAPGRLTDEQRDLATSAERNVRRLEDFTDELLEMAQLEHGGVALEKEELRAASLLGEVVADHAAQARRKSQPLTLVAEGDIPPFHVDPRRMRQALGNLVDNAILYSPRGSPIVIRAAREDGAVRIEVRDRGSGIKAEERERIFDRFYRGGNADGTSGTGLGLAIARSILSLHGGDLKYQDTPGGGSTFVVTVPC